MKLFTFTFADGFVQVTAPDIFVAWGMAKRLHKSDAPLIAMQAGAA